MRATCARAVQIGLRSLAFTEHADFTPWQLHGAEVPPGVRGRVSPGGTFLGEPLDVEGYLECLEACRRQFPELRILSGVELSEPHRHPAATADLLTRGDFDRCLGSVHALPTFALSRWTPTPVSKSRPGLRAAVADRCCARLPDRGDRSGR